MSLIDIENLLTNPQPSGDLAREIEMYLKKQANGNSDQINDNNANNGANLSASQQTHSQYNRKKKKEERTRSCMTRPTKIS